MRRQNPERHRKTLLVGAVCVVAVALLAYGMWGLFERYAATNNPNPTIPAEVITYSDETPDETPIDDECDAYAVADDAPRTITIPSVDISGCIQQVGLDESGAIAVPTNIHLAGWYVGAAVPGEEGISVIDGHVLGRYDDAIFTSLRDVEIGDSIDIEMGDGSMRSFAIMEVSSHSVEDTMPVALEALDGVDRQLSLITCDGAFDAEAQTYDQRLVVRAALVD